MIRIGRKGIIGLLVVFSLIWIVLISLGIYSRFGGEKESYTFTVTSDTRLLIESTDASLIVYRKENGDATLSVKGAKDSSVSIRGDIVEIDISSRDVGSASAELELPDTTIALFSLKSLSGDIDIAPLDAKEINIRSESGDIRLNLINGERLSAEAISGNISIQDAELSEKASIKTQSGSIDVVTLRSGYGEISSESGDLELSDNNLKSLDLKTASGDIFILDGNNCTIDYYLGPSSLLSLEKSTYTSSGTIEGGDSHIRLTTASGNAHYSEHH